MGLFTVSAIILERALLEQLQRYNALPHWKRGTSYGRSLYSDIRDLNEALLSHYANDRSRRPIP